jgi:HAD superfamily hydrolase (TIGR01509 family)
LVAPASNDLRALVAGVKLLSLDAGNTIIFLDHARIARFVTERGFPVVTDDVVRAEGDAKRGLGGDPTAASLLLDVAWAGRDRPGGKGWGQVIGTSIHRAGVPASAVPALLEELWDDHVRMNLYSLVPTGLAAAIERVRKKLGVVVVVVSNSEGMLAALFEQLGILPHFDLIVDSGILGVEKPDPRIFAAALQPFDMARSAALHLGDTYATDVLGARAAGLRTALIDPFHHYDGLYPDLLRVHGVVAVCEAMEAQ